VARPATVPDSYPQVLDRLKAEIAGARTKAALAVNAELVGLYWRVGHEIAARQGDEGWGARVIDRLSQDLRSAFPGQKGLSARNLRYMRDFAKAWPSEGIWQQAAAKLPWGHNMVLLDKLTTREERLFYISLVTEHGWSRAVLEARIASRLHEREGKALTNFADRLPDAAAKAAQLITRDPYSLEFLDIAAEAEERDLERALIADLRKFMLELGAGFAFVGSQVPLGVDGEDFFVDLLFFHIPTNRYVVIDLKIGKFVPRDAGQINFYVNVIDDKISLDHHAPTIGLVLCAGHSASVVRYTLEGLTKPVGVASWQLGNGQTDLVAEAPADSNMPSAQQLQQGLDDIVAAHAEEIRAVEATSEDGGR
jgi:predicted nuclease of restriction endonuclease-like (RecB) superfamily